jgi:hypothetical protein
MQEEGLDDLHAAKNDSAEQVLTGIGGAIRRATSHISDANKSGDRDYVDHVADQECDMIEALLGTAFVVCQTYISAVVAAALRLTKHANDQNLSATKLPTSAFALMAKGEPFNAQYSKITVLWELGNFFKHRDEWGYKWPKEKSRNSRTVNAIKVAGLQQGSTGNLRNGATALGNPHFDNCNHFADIAASWAKALQAEFTKELRL